MRRVTYSMTVSLDGFVTDPDGGLDWSVTDEESFRLATDEVRHSGVHLLGRRVYEAMLFWETAADAPSFGEGHDLISKDALLEFVDVWCALPKVVFSHSLTTVQGNARLATDGLAAEIGRLRAEPGEGSIALAGATLAAAAAPLDLIDEYRLRVAPVLLGGGLPYFARNVGRADLELVENRVLSAGTTYLRYRRNRSAPTTVG